MSKRQNLCSPRYAFYVSLNRNYAVYIFVADKRVEELDNTRHVIQIGASINNSPRESSQKNGDLMLHRTNLMERALRQYDTRERVRFQSVGNFISQDMFIERTCSESGQ